MSKSPNQLHVVTALHAVQDKVQLAPHRVAETAVALLVKPHARVAMTRAPAPVDLVAMMLHRHVGIMVHRHVGTISHRHGVTMAHPLAVMIVQYAMNREPAAGLRAIRAQAAVAPRVVTNQVRTELHVVMSRAILVQVVVRMSVRVAMHARRAAMSRAMHALVAEMMSVRVAMHARRAVTNLAMHVLRAEMMIVLVVMTRVQRADLLVMIVLVVMTRVQRADLHVMTAPVVTMHAEHHSGQREVARNLIAHAANDQRVIAPDQIDLAQIAPRLARLRSLAPRSHAHAVRRRQLALV